MQRSSYTTVHYSRAAVQYNMVSCGCVMYMRNVHPRFYMLTRSLRYEAHGWTAVTKTTSGGQHTTAKTTATLMKKMTMTMMTMTTTTTTFNAPTVNMREIG